MTSSNADPAKPINNGVSLLRIWGLELLSTTCAIACVVGIVMMLKPYDGKSLDLWTHSYSINTVLSILVLAMRSFISVPIVSGISQLMWSQFYERSRKLKTIETMDGARKGLFGSIHLLLTLAPWKLASLMSLMFVASYALGPIIQQSLEIQSRRMPSKNGIAQISVFSSNHYEDYDNFTTKGLQNITLATSLAIYEGIYNVGSSKSPNSPKATCSTGNCEFRPFQSLGFCSRCYDVGGSQFTHEFKVHTNESAPMLTPQTRDDLCLKPAGCTETWRLSKNNLSAEFFESSQRKSYTVINATTDGNLSITGLQDIPPIVTLTTITNLGDDDGASISASQCVLYFCPINYHLGFNEGAFYEYAYPVFAKFSNFDDGGLIQDVTLTPQDCTTGVSNCSYTIDGQSWRTLREALEAVWGSETSLSVDTDRPAVYSELNATRMLHTFGAYAIMESVASSLTNRLRTSNLQGNTTSFMNGTAFDESSYEYYYKVNWPLFAYPATVVFLVLVILLLIILETRHEHLWKDSILATLYAGQTLTLAGPQISVLESGAKHIEICMDREGRLRGVEVLPDYSAAIEMTS